MGDIMDYVEWRGDLSMKQDPFNEVDNLVLSQLAYVDFAGVVGNDQEESDETITIREASKRFFKLHTEEELLKNKAMTRLAPFLMRKMAEGERFGKMKLSRYINIIDNQEEKQFSAIHIALGDGNVYVAYRGTDNTIVGWKEDFNMTYIMPVPSQVEAVKYLNRTMKYRHCKIYLGGHSKGGNLAVYAAMNCEDGIRSRILQIYNNDGPGFIQEIVESKKYQAIVERVKTIIPQSSIIGMLLEHAEQYEIVRSGQTGFQQHDIMSWEVLGKRFTYLDDVTNESRVIDYTIKVWLNGLGKEQRAQFVEALFTLLESTGAKTFTELSNSKLRNMNVILKSYNNMDMEARDMLIQTIKTLIAQYNHIHKTTKALRKNINE